MKISSWPRALCWPTYSASVGGRSDRSICSSCGEGRAVIRRSVSTLTPGILPEGSLPEAPERSKAHDIDVASRADRAAADVGIALPFAPQRDVAIRFVGEADAPSSAVVLLLGAEE